MLKYSASDLEFSVPSSLSWDFPVYFIGSWTDDVDIE